MFMTLYVHCIGYGSLEHRLSVDYHEISAESADSGLESCENRCVGTGLSLGQIVVVDWYYR